MTHCGAFFVPSGYQNDGTIFKSSFRAHIQELCQVAWKVHAGTNLQVWRQTRKIMGPLWGQSGPKLGPFPGSMLVWMFWGGVFFLLWGGGAFSFGGWLGQGKQRVGEHGGGSRKCSSAVEKETWRIGQVSRWLVVCASAHPCHFSSANPILTLWFWPCCFQGKHTEVWPVNSVAGPVLGKMAVQSSGAQGFVTPNPRIEMHGVIIAVLP